METEGKEIRFVFPDQANELARRLTTGQEVLPAPDLLSLIKKGGEEIKEETLRNLSTGIEEIQDWFHSFRIKQIEFWVKGKIETGRIVSLVISTAAEGGLKFIIEPKS
jgi:hypothetical protein